MMLFPDLPVYKHQKKSIEDVSINVMDFIMEELHSHLRFPDAKPG